MRAEDAVRTLNGTLRSTAERRKQLASETEELTKRLGAVAKLLKENYGQSQSASAAAAGVSAAYIGELIARAEDDGVTVEDPIGSVLWISGTGAADYVRSQDARVDRIIASFADFDTLFMSGVHPRSLARESHLICPHMMWHLDTGEWIAIDKVQVGYIGTGPGWAVHALESLGLDAELVRDIAYRRVSDVPLPDGEPFHSDHWPKYPVPALELAPGGWVVSQLDDGQPHRASRLALRGGTGEDDTLGGFYPDRPTKTPLNRWIDLLDGPECPSWARGGRVARLYLKEGAAPRVTSVFHGYRPPFTLIIEQGDLQLWFQAFPPHDQTQWLSEEVYDALLTADVYPGELAERDARGSFWRWVDTHVAKRQRPDMIEIGGSLRREPSEFGGA